MSHDSRAGNNRQESEVAVDADNINHCAYGPVQTGDLNLFPSPFPPLLLMIFSVFVVETLIEAFITLTVDLTLVSHIIVDASGTVLLLSPIFYLVLYRPYKKLDAERMASKEEVQILSRQMIKAIEEERKTLARDLHDDFGQILTALQFGVETIKVSCETGLGMGEDGEAGRNACRSQGQKLSELIAELGDHVRMVSTGLRPTMLDELGLVVTLKWLTDEFRKQRQGLDVSFLAEGDGKRYPPEIELGIFRICQEALNNVAKHSQAHQVEVRLLEVNSELELLIKDDGVGFTGEELRQARAGLRGQGRQSVGLLGMRERVSTLNGQLDISTEKGQGVEICAKIPTIVKRRKED